jgi:hypothetical protein
MKRTAVTLALSLSFAPWVASGQEVTFSQATPTLGDARVETKRVENQFELRISRGGQVLQTQAAAETEVGKTRAEVRGVDQDGLANRVALVVEERIKTMKSQGMVQEVESPLSGESYVGQRGADGTWSVLREGEPAPEDEAALAQSELEGLRQAGGLGRFLVGKTVKVGEVLQLKPADAARILRLEGGVTVQRFTMTLKSTQTGPGFEVAVFEVKAVLQTSQQGIQMEFTLAGSQTVGVETLWPVSLSLKGPIAISGGNPAQGMEVAGEGTMKLEIETAYSKVDVQAEAPASEGAGREGE